MYGLMIGWNDMLMEIVLELLHTNEIFNDCNFVTSVVVERSVMKRGFISEIKIREGIS